MFVITPLALRLAIFVITLDTPRFAIAVTFEDVASKAISSTMADDASIFKSSTIDDEASVLTSLMKSAVTNDISLAKSDVIKLALPATVVMLLEIVAQLVILLEIDAQVVTLACIPASVLTAFVAVVPSCKSARVAISLVTDARVVTSVVDGPTSGLPDVLLKAKYFPFLSSYVGSVISMLVASYSGAAKALSTFWELCCVIMIFVSKSASSAVAVKGPPVV